MTPLFHLENIVRNYPDPASRDPHAVRTVLNLSELDIRAGEILGIRGHNGSGKSTLLRIIALLEPPDSGTVLFEGRPAGTDDLHLRRQVTLLDVYKRQGSSSPPPTASNVSGNALKRKGSTPVPCTACR